MAESAWERYKKQHSLQTGTEEKESEWKRYKRENNIRAEDDSWRNRIGQKVQERKDLRTQESNLRKAAPTATGNRDAEWAAYYNALSAYGNKWGDRDAYDRGYRGYTEAMNKVSGQYASHQARHQEADKNRDTALALNRMLPWTSEPDAAESALKDQERRYNRDVGFYNRMARDANTAGSREMWDKAAAGNQAAYKNYSSAERAYNNAVYASQKAMKEKHPEQYYKDAYAEGREEAHGNVAWYQKQIEDALTQGDYKAVNDRIEAMVQAPLTTEERKKASAYIDQLYENQGVMPEYTGEGNTYYIDQIIQKSETGELGRFLSSEEGDEARAEIEKEFGVPASLALSNPEEYARQVRYARQYNRAPDSDEQAFWYSYFNKGKETYQTENARNAFLYRSENEISNAMKNPAASGAQMDSFTRAYQAINDLNMMLDMLDNVDAGVSADNYTIKYLANDLQNYGVHLGELSDENILAAVRNALEAEQKKYKLMEAALKQSGFDTDVVAKRIKFEQEKRYDEARQASIQEWAKTASGLDKAAATAGAIAEDVYLAPAEYLFGTLPNVAGATGNRDTANYTPVTGFTDQSDLIKSEIGANMSGGGKFLYDTLVSAIESTLGASSFGEAGYLLSMGLRSADAKTNEILQRGGSPDQALIGGVAAGVIEAASEVFSVQELFKLAKNTDGLKALAIGILRASGFEASEEITGGIAEAIADSLIMGNLSERSTTVRNYMNDGLTYDEAIVKAWEDNALQTLEGAASAALSAGGSAVVFGGRGIWNTAKNEIADHRGERAANQVAGVTSTNEQQAAMRAYAEANGIEWRTAENAAQAVKQGETATQNAENAEQQAQAKEQPKTRQEKRQERREEKAQAKSEREIGADVRRVQEHIDKQLAGKSVQEQTAIRDKLVQQYGEAIAPAVYSAVRTNAYQQAAQNANPTAIRAAKEAALEGVTDQDMRRAVSSAYDQAAVELAVKTKNTDALGRYYQQIRGTGTGSMTMEAIVKGKDGQETRSAITGMSEDGKSVTLADGSTVAVKDLQADADTMDIIHEISALGLGKNTDKVFQAYKKSDKTGLDGYRWIMDYTTAIDQGRNRRISLQEAIKRSSLDAETVMEAYEMGHKETMDETRKAVQKNENRPKRKGVTGRMANIDTSAIQNEPMSKQEREQFDLANQIFELLGVDVKWESSKTKNGKYVGANGSYLNGAVTLDIHAGRNDVIRDINSGILATTGHELTHFLQEYAPEQYQALKEFVLQQIVKNGKYGEATLERMIQDKQNRSSKKLTKSQAEDEVVADACQTMLRDSKALREFAEQKPEAAKGIIQWLADWFKKIKAAFSRSAQLSEQARFMEKLEKDVREAFGKLWDDALREAVRVHDEIGNMESGDNAQNSDRDTAYLDAVERGDMETAQRMVDEAAKRAGYPYEVWHGTNGGDFTVFDWGKTQRADAGWYGRGHYFATHKDGASVYGKRVIHSYLRIKNPFNFQNELLDVNGQRLPVGAQSLRFMETMGALDPEYFGKRTLEAYDNWSDQSRSIKWADIGKEITAILDGMKLRLYADGHCEWAYDYGGWTEESTKNEYATQEVAEKAKEAAAYELLTKRLNARLPIDPAAYYLGGDMDASDRFSEVLKKKGYDGVLQGTDGDEIVVFDSPQIKSADPVTYDDSGKVIPLSERFNPEQEDIRYSEREDAKPRSAQAQRDAGYKLSESKFYSLYSAHKLNMTGRGNVQEQIASIMADGFKGDGGFGNNVMPTNISYDVDENGKRIPRGLSAQKYAPKKGEYILLVPKEGIEVKGSRYNFTERVKPGYKPAFDYEIVQADYDGQPYYEMYERAYDKSQAGKADVTLDFQSQSAAPEDGTLYSERDYSTPSDLDLLLNASESDATNPNQLGLLKDYKALGKRAEILQKRLDALMQEKADREASGKEYKAGYLKIKESEIAKLERELEAVHTSMEKKMLTPQLFKLLEAERDAAAKIAVERKEEVFQRYKERKQKTAIRNRIANLKAELQRRLTNPTDRSYVPAELATSMVDLLNALDTSPREGTQAAAKYQTVSEGLRALAEAYNSLTTDETVGWEYKSEYDEEIRDQIKELAKTMQGRNIRELSLDELKQVYEAVKIIRDSMRQATKLLNTKKFRDIYEAIQSIVDQQKRMTPIADVGWKERNKRRRLLEGLSVMRAVEMMSGWERDSALYSMFQGVEQGQVDADNWIMGYDKAMRSLKTGKNEKAYRDALTKQLDFGATDKESGKTVKMTKLQAIQLYMTWQREQANDKLVHLQKGGATIRDALAIQNGKGSKAASHTVLVTPELISNIENSLTEWDRAYMKEIRGYLDKEAKAVNRVLYALKHRVLTTEAAYMPYVVDKGYLETKLEGSDVFNLFVKTPGSTQALQKKAPQPVIIDGLDNMMARHVRDQAQYIGLALPIRDFAKVFNGRLSSEDGDVYTSLKKTIEDNFEAGGTHLLVQALLDIQNSGAGEAWKSQIAAALNRLHSSFVKAALLINPSVTIKQAASYIAAESVLSQVALERGNHPIWTSTDKSKAFMPGGLIAHLFNSPEGRTAQRLYDEIDAHTSMHYIRRNGMSHAELANEAQRDGRIKRAVNAVGARMEKNKAGHIARKAGEMLNPLNWIQRMDVATTATLWVACKEQAKLDGMKAGTTEYWNRVTELYERCLRETQPMYDGLHRTAHQKQGGGLMQYLFPFRTVPVQNHGQIVAAYETMKAMKDQSKEKQAAAKKFFAKTVWAQAQSAFVFSLMTFLAAALKRKTKKYRDEDEEFTLESFLEGLVGDTASTLFSVAFPMWGSEAWSAGSRILDKIKGTSGYSYDAFTVGAVDMLNELASSGDKLFADVGKMIRGEDVSGADFWSHVLTMLTKGAKIAGIPADTVKTYYAGIKANVQDAIEGRIPALNDESWERSNATNARRLIKALETGDEEKAEAVMEEMRQNILKDKPNLKADKVNAKIQSAVQSYVKQQYLDDEMSEEKAIHYMVEYGSADDENDAFWKIREWDAREAWDGEADDFSFSKYTTLREIIDNVGDISEEMQYLQDHGVKFEDANKEIKSYIGKQLKAGEYDEDEAMKTLQAYHKVKDEKTKQYRPDTDDESWFTVQEWKAKAEHADDEDYSWSKYEDLFAAMDNNGDIEPHADELESHGIKADSIKNAIVGHVKERYEAGELDASEAMRLLQKYRGMDANEAYWKVDEWDAKEAAYNDGEEFTNSNYRDLYAAIDANADASAAIRELTAHGYKERSVYSAAKDHLVERFEQGEINETQLKNQLSRYAKIVKQDEVSEIVTNAKCYKETGYRLGNVNEAYLDGEITAEKFKQIRVKYGGKTAEEAKKQVRWLDLKKSHPNLDISESVSNAWYDGTTKTRENGRESAKAAGMSIEAYLKARAVLDDIKDSNENGTGEDEYIAALAKMNLTPRQKDALYYEKYKGGSRKGIYKTW